MIELNKISEEEFNQFIKKLKEKKLSELTKDERSTLATHLIIIACMNKDWDKLEKALLCLVTNLDLNTYELEIRKDLFYRSL